jgi:hypothetical protein
LGLGAAVCFIAGDVREVDLTAGTIFFLFTPFKGRVFDEVMERLKVVAGIHSIRVIGYGPCSKDLARIDWLRRDGESAGDEGSGEYELQFFASYTMDG